MLAKNILKLSAISFLSETGILFMRISLGGGRFIAKFSDCLL